MFFIKETVFTNKKIIFAVDNVQKSKNITFIQFS